MDDPALQDRWLAVTWDSAGHVAYVNGSHLHLAGREILGRCWEVSEVTQALGPPDRQDGEALNFLRWDTESGEITAIARQGRVARFALATSLEVWMSGGPGTPP